MRHTTLLLALTLTVLLLAASLGYLAHDALSHPHDPQINTVIIATHRPQTNPALPHISPNR